MENGTTELIQSLLLDIYEKNYQKLYTLPEDEACAFVYESMKDIMPSGTMLNRVYMDGGTFVTEVKLIPDNSEVKIDIHETEPSAYDILKAIAEDEEMIIDIYKKDKDSLDTSSIQED